MTALEAVPTACVAGCTTPGEHLPNHGVTCDCHCHDGAEGIYPCNIEGGCHLNHPDDTCKGCRPRPAEYGLLCHRSRTRLASALSMAPDLVIHLRDNVEPGGNTNSSSGSLAKVKKKFAPPAPADLSAIDSADLIYSLLSSWAGALCDATGLVGPIPARAWTISGQVAGLKTGSDGGESAPVAHWLHTHLDMLCEQSWVAEMLVGPDSLVRVVERNTKRWPTEEQPTYLPTPCPSCQRLDLTRQPPTWTGGPVTITCRCCNEVLDEARYGLYTRVILESRKVVPEGVAHE